jgi:hypothetical protein
MWSVRTFLVLNHLLVLEQFLRHVRRQNHFHLFSFFS